MFIELTVTNFRSIKKKQTLSFFAESSANHLSKNIAYPAKDKIGVLRTTGIYGANASGKSNWLQAFKALSYIICSSGDLKDGDEIPCYEPFLLSKSASTKPITFEIEFFSKDNLRFIYKVSFNQMRIVSEALDYYPSRSKANLFTRTASDSWEDISFGGRYKGGKKKFAFFKNNSYLSKAGNSADAPEIIRSIYNFFRKNVDVIASNQIMGLANWKENKEIVNKISSILSEVDTGISGLRFKEEELKDFALPDEIPKEIRDQIFQDESKKAVFLHKGKNDYEHEFSEEMESSGTIKLFRMLPFLLTVFDKGSIFIIDELDNSFHPHVAELIIKLFNDPKINKHNSQLIFSTHNINLMSPEIMRRDQIWLTEKTHGETMITSLDEFDKNTVKIDSPFNKWYSDGRFGAIPKIDKEAISKIMTKQD